MGFTKAEILEVREHLLEDIAELAQLLVDCPMFFSPDRGVNMFQVTQDLRLAIQAKLSELKAVNLLVDNTGE
jgi:hypothetical protein